MYHELNEKNNKKIFTKKFFDGDDDERKTNEK